MLALQVPKKKNYIPYKMLALQGLKNWQPFKKEY